MYAKLPSMKSLIAFEAVARHRSIARAAEEIALTSSALSKQIQALETQIGARLFIRTTRRIELTEQGKQLAAGVKGSLQTLHQAFDSVAPQRKRDTLRLLASPAFNTVALIPRLSEFKAKYPYASFSFLSDDSGRIPDFEREPVDAAVVFLPAVPDRPELAFFPVFDRCYLQPLCSPSLLRGGKPFKKTADLAKYPWLKNRKAPAFWDSWLCAAGAKGLDPVEVCWFDDTASVVEAAVAGMGIAMLGGADSSPDPFRKRLGPAHALRVYYETANQYLVYPRESSNRCLFALRDWLQKEYNPSYEMQR